MKDTKFFEQALESVAPWKVLEVNMHVTAKKVEVKVDCHSAQMWLDPQSGKRLHVHWISADFQSFSAQRRACHVNG